jgi:hypothetical protein
MDERKDDFARIAHVLNSVQQDVIRDEGLTVHSGQVGKAHKSLTRRISDEQTAELARSRSRDGRPDRGPRCGGELRQ